LLESGNQLITYFAALVLTLSVAIFLVVRGLTGPIERLTIAARAMASGDLDREIKASGAEELTILGESFARMRESIKEKMSDLAEKNKILREEVAEREKAEIKNRRYVEIVEEQNLRFELARKSSSGIGVWDLDLISGELKWDDSMLSIYGIQRSEFRGNVAAWSERVHPEDRAKVVKEFEAAIAGIGEYQPRFRLMRPDRQERWVDGTAHVVRDDAGRPIRMVGVNIDVTNSVRTEMALARANEELEARVARRTHDLSVANAQLKDALEVLHQTQDELVRNERLASLGSLVAGVAHELNTPIGNCIMVSSVLEASVRQVSADIDAGTLRRSGLMSFVKDAIEGTSLLSRNLVRASELISNFKQVSVDQTSAQRREFDLATIVAEIMATMQPQLKKTPHQFIEDIPKGLLMDSYPGPLGQVVVNLVNNCIIHAFTDAVPGTVTISARPLGTDTVRLMVSDDGCGMAPEILTKVFDPFFTTKLGQGGSGLGLHIVYGTVTQLLGGTINVSSVVGKGSVFTIDLPLRAPLVESMRPRSAADMQAPTS